MRLRSVVARYAVSLAAVALALGLRMLAASWTGTGAPFVLFFGAMLVTSLLAGFGPALLTLALSVPLAGYLFVVGAGYPVSQAAFQSMLFGIDGLVVLYMTWLIERDRRGLEETNRNLRHVSEDRARALARVRETIELAPDAYFLANLDARFIDVNQAACRLLDYERDELVGKTIFDVIPPEDADRLTAVKAELLEPTNVNKADWTMRRKDGTLVPVEVSANIIPDGRWQAFIRDISERRRIEDERQVFVSLLDNSSDFIGIADPAGKPIYLNAAGRRMIGLPPDFPIDRVAIEDCYPPELLSFVRDVILATMRERGQWKGETFFQNVSTHAKIPVSDTHFMIRDASGERIIGMGTVTRDISDARRVAEEREQLLAREQLARREAERAVVARDSILGIVAHDLRNPLSTILMQAELLERSEPELERRDQTPRLVLMRSAERMNSLIQDLLDVAVMENGQLAVQRERLSAGDLVREAVESQAMLASSSGLELRLEVHPGVHDVLGDRKRLLQVFDNLIGNALKFTPKSGCITVEAAARDDEVVFSVADTGPGIARESLQHIFEPFWQAATRAARLGAGLGLPITRGIVDAHGGRIWVESELERGSTFFFAIPAAPAEKDASRAVKPSGRSAQRRDSRRPRRQRS